MNLSSYRDLFGDRELRRILLSSVLPRLPVGMNALGLTLLTQSQTQSFAQAGWVTSAYLIGMAVQAPVVGRYVDRNSPRGVVMPQALGHALAMVLLVWAASAQLGLGWLMAAALLAGLSLPAISMTVRSLVRKADWSPAIKQSAFATDAIIMELTFIVGPLVISAALLVGSPKVAVLLSAAFTLLGSWQFVRSGALQRWGEVEHGLERHWLGPLQSSGVRRALILSLLIALSIGLNEISIPGFATAQGVTRQVGWFYAAMSLPSALAGFVYGSRHWSWPLNRQIAASAVWLAVGSVIMAMTSSPMGFAWACAATGLAFSPLITALSMQLGALAPKAYATEAFTWSATMFMVGVGLGFWLGGLLVERHGWAYSLWGAALCLAVATVWCPFVPAVRTGHSTAH